MLEEKANLYLVICFHIHASEKNHVCVSYKNPRFKVFPIYS